jgi:hypothetical protein
MADEGVYFKVVAPPGVQGIRADMHVNSYTLPAATSINLYLGVDDIDAGLVLKPQDGLWHAFMLLTGSQPTYLESSGSAPSDLSWHLEFSILNGTAILTVTHVSGQTITLSNSVSIIPASGLNNFKVVESLAPEGNLAANLGGTIDATWSNVQVLASGQWQNLSSQQQFLYPSASYISLSGAFPGPVRVVVNFKPLVSPLSVSTLLIGAGAGAFLGIVAEAAYKLYEARRGTQRGGKQPSLRSLARGL